MQVIKPHSRSQKVIAVSQWTLLASQQGMINCWLLGVTLLDVLVISLDTCILLSSLCCFNESDHTLHWQWLSPMLGMCIFPGSYIAMKSKQKGTYLGLGNLKLPIIWTSQLSIHTCISPKRSGNWKVIRSHSPDISGYLICLFKKSWILRL